MALESVRASEGRIDRALRLPEKLDGIAGGSVEVYDLKPDNLKTEVPLVIAPGWAAGADIFKGNMKLFAEAGRRTLGISAPHGIPPGKDAHFDLPLVEVRKAAALSYVLDAKQLERIDALAHSEGAIYTSAVALAQPGRFRSITYVSPSGLIGGDSFWKIAMRADADTRRSIIDAFQSSEDGRWSRLAPMLVSLTKNIFSSPGRSIQEAKAIAAAHIGETVRALHDKGVKIFVVQPVGDKIYPMDRINPDTRTADKKPILDSAMVDGFISTGDPSKTGAISDTHNAVILSPEKYTHAIDAMLDTLDKKS